MRKHTQNSINFQVGENAQENWKLILGADKNSWWLHADSCPSTHIIIESDVVYPDDIDYAFSLCKIYTKNHKVNDYVLTQISNIKLGSKPGEVRFKHTNKVIRGPV